MAASDTALSKLMSLVLRHKPDEIGLVLDEQGWVALDELVEKLGTRRPCTRADVLRVIEHNEKRRFTLSDDGTRVRAAQGHSVDVDLGHTPREPPAVLYHGTATRFLDAILAEGLKPGSRQQVHLSADASTARTVGQRHGSPVVLTVDAAAMHAAGFRFFIAENGVWLTDHVPPGFLSSRCP